MAFARRVRDVHPDVPVALQSSVPANRALAESVGAAFLLKESPVLLQQLRRFMIDNFGFGDFVFRLPDGTEVGRASDLRTLEDAGRVGAGREHRVPLRAQPLLPLAQGAHRVRRRPPHAAAQALGLPGPRVAPARPGRVDPAPTASSAPGRPSSTSTGTPSTRGTSSRGSAAGRSAARRAGWRSSTCCSTSTTVRSRFADVEIAVPPSVVLATDAFDRFLDDNDLRGFAHRVRRRGGAGPAVPGRAAAGRRRRRPRRRSST